MSLLTRFALGFDNVLGPVFNGAVVTPTIKNGVGLHAPNVEQDAAYPMAKLLTADRYAPWKTSNATPAGDNAVKVDIALGATRSFRFVGVHGIGVISVAEGLTAPPVLVRAWRQTGTYDGTGTWTQFGADASFGSVRDVLIDNGADASVDSLRLSFSDTGTAPFSIGRLFAGNPSADMNRVYSGADDVYVHAVQRTANAAIGPAQTYIGKGHRELSLQLDSLGDAEVAVLEKVRTTQQSFFYLTHTGVIFECILLDIRAAVRHTWRPPNRYSMTLDLLQLA